MLSTELSTIFLGISVFAALFVAAYAVNRAVRAEKLAFEAVSFIESQNKRSLSLRRMAEVEATLTDLRDSYEALLDSHKKLRSRIGMRATREKRKSAENGVDLDATPVDEAEKAAYKAQLRAQLRESGQLK